MMTNTMLEQSKEKGIVDILSNDGIKLGQSFSKKVRTDQLKIINHTITRKEWEQYFIKEYSEKELITNFFSSNRGSYIAFVTDIDYQKKQEASTISGDNPLFVDEDDVVKFYADDFEGKSSSKEDHNSVISSNDLSIGTPQYLIEKRMISSGMINQFTVKGLQGLVFTEGGFITADEAKKEISKIKQFMIYESQKNHSAFKGEDLITSTALKKIRKELKKKGVDYDYSNTVGLEIRKNIVNDEVWLGNLLADVQLSKNDPSQKPIVEKKLRTLFKRMLGDTFNVIVEPIAETTVYLGKVGNEDIKDLKI